MRILNAAEQEKVSGGNLTGWILDYFSNMGSNPNKAPGNDNSGSGGFVSTIVSPALGKGEEYGKVMVIGLVTAVAAVATGIYALGKLFSVK